MTPGSVGIMTSPSATAAMPRRTYAWGERGPEAAAAVATGGVLAVAVAFASLGLVRDTLHFNCSWGIGGEWGPAGTWVCADGIGYAGVAFVFGGMSGLLLLIGLGISFARPSFGRSIAYLSLAAVSLAWVGWWTFYAATAYTGPRPVGESGQGLWVVTVLPGLTLGTLGLVVGAVGALTLRPWSRAGLWVGFSLLLVATALQPGIGVATLVSTGMVAAAGVGRQRVR